MKKEVIILSMFSLGVLGFSIISWFPNPEVKDFVRTSLSAILCLFIILGHNWARWIMVVLLGLGGLTSIIFIFKTEITSNTNGYIFILIMLTMGAFYIAFALLLALQLFIKGYFEKTKA